ncbi:uncharacterized protein LOC132270068 [Cornus florida]|uniref:uncharacterized protein LOC132270068 n=1 Tax=Cornus florida TaxID=4283 RepID=UPI00289E30FB|nr:uncharacterized protein LOC132270068 [Cornus florida]
MVSTLIWNLLGLNSLTELDLSDCNLSERGIPSDLGSLSSLKMLNLSRNSFVSLPATISHLSQLVSLRLAGCKRLEALPELPSSINLLYADDCPSLISSRDLQQNLGTSTYLQLPPDCCEERYIGIAVCGVFNFSTPHSCLKMRFHLVDHNDKQCSEDEDYFWIPRSENLGSKHIMLCYIPTQEVHWNKNEWRQLGVSFEFVDAANGFRRLPPRKWGVRIVCEKDVKSWKDGYGNLGIMDGTDEAVAVEDKNNGVNRKRDRF